MVYLLLLFFFSASIAAMPEDDFARLRSDIFSVSNQSYQAGIEKIDDTLKQHRYQLPYKSAKLKPCRLSEGS